MASLRVHIILSISLCGVLSQAFAKNLIFRDDTCSDSCIEETCASWSYEGKAGPKSWGSMPGFEVCGNGKRQSPINIVSKNAVKKRLGEIQFTMAYASQIDGMYHNDGDSVKFTPDDTTGLIITSGPYCNNTYQLAQFHFHWGCTDSQGSEHTIDDHGFSMEIHLVHWNTKYGSFSAAKSHRDGLAVLGVLLQASPNNPRFNGLGFDAALQCIKTKDSEYPGHIRLSDFLIAVHPGQYYSYAGSLTTPSCDEIVDWTVFKGIVPINSHQVEELRKLGDCHCKKICGTNRPTQPLYSRIVHYNE